MQTTRSFLAGCVRQLAVAGLIGCAASRTYAQADEYCQKVKARAGSEAALLVAPKLFGQGLRYPSGAEATSLGPVRDNYQLRVGMTLSALDVVRGIRLNSVADSDCRARTNAEALTRAIDTAYDAVQLVALRAQLAFLEQRVAVWNEVLGRAHARLEAKVITNVDLDQVRSRISAIESRLEQLRAQIKLFELRQVALPDTALSELVQLYRSAELEREQKVSGSKALSAWSMVLSGGALMPLVRVETRPAVDWFGWVELSYSLGGLWSAGHEQEYLKAREAELHGARYELSQRAQAMERQLRGHSQHAERQLSLLEAQLRFLDLTIASLESADVSATAQAHDNLVLERVQSESERVLWQTLITTLKGLGYGSHG